MTDKFEEIVDNLKQPSHWVRLPFMLAFGFILYLVFVPVVIVMMVAQILFALTTGQSNRNLRGLGSVVQQYVSQIIDYITYNSDERPFPFSDFPEEDISVVENPAPKKTESGVKADDSESKSEKKEGKTKPKATKPVTKAKKSAAKSKTAAASTATAVKPSTTKKPAKKKSPAKKKVSAPAVSDSTEENSPAADAQTSTEPVVKDPS